MLLAFENIKSEKKQYVELFHQNVPFITFLMERKSEKMVESLDYYLCTPADSVASL